MRRKGEHHTAEGALVIPTIRSRPLSAARLRGYLWQALALLLVLAFLAFIARNAAINMARLNINTGFGFLTRPAGFAIAQHFISYDEASSYFVAFFVALLNTVIIAAVAIVCATMLGFVIGLARLSSNRLVAATAGAYVDLIRNVPLLLQLFYWYFAVLRPLPGPRQSLDLLHLHIAFLNARGLFVPAPMFEPGSGAVLLALLVALALFSLLWRWARGRREIAGRTPRAAWIALASLLFAFLAIAAAEGWPLRWEVPVLAGFNFRGGLVLSPEFVAMSVALSLYGAAYIAEIVRAGVAAVPVGQSEAARALGMGPLLVARKVIVPQALRIILPPLAGQYILLTKNTTLAAAIAYPDLMLIFGGTVLNQTGQPLEVMIITIGTYLALSFAIAAAMNAANRRLRRTGTPRR
ncbi:MAG TPA: ABC transporter permease subunit [Stellaceae bacterium]|nr:ABC transporter permease subunit [Stellaceae bacterium]